MTGAGRIAERHQQAARREAVERCDEGVFADAVVHDRHFFTAGQRDHPRGNVFGRVVDDVVAAARACELGFFRGTDRADHRDAEVARPLAGDQSDTAGRGVEQNRLAAAQFVRLAKQILNGEAFQQHRGRRIAADAGQEV